MTTKKQVTIVFDDNQEYLRWVSRWLNASKQYEKFTTSYRDANLRSGTSGVFKLSVTYTEYKFRVLTGDEV